MKVIKLGKKSVNFRFRIYVIIAWVAPIVLENFPGAIFQVWEVEKGSLPVFADPEDRAVVKGDRREPDGILGNGRQCKR